MNSWVEPETLENSKEQKKKNNEKVTLGVDERKPKKELKSDKNRGTIAF